jgi:hypothetical protein
VGLRLRLERIDDCVSDFGCSKLSLAVFFFKLWGWRFVRSGFCLLEDLLKRRWIGVDAFIYKMCL